MEYKPLMEAVLGYPRPEGGYSYEAFAKYGKVGEFNFDSSNEEYCQFVIDNGYRVPRSEATLECFDFTHPGAYKARLQDMWERFMELQNKEPEEETVELTIYFKEDGNPNVAPHTKQCPTIMRMVEKCWYADKSADPYLAMLTDTLKLELDFERIIRLHVNPICHPQCHRDEYMQWADWIVPDPELEHNEMLVMYYDDLVPVEISPATETTVAERVERLSANVAGKVNLYTFLAVAEEKFRN